MEQTPLLATMTSESKYYNQQQFEDEESGGSSADNASPHRRRWFGGNNKKTEPVSPTSTAGNSSSLLDQEEQEQEIYVVKQRYGVLSILFSIVQTVVLIIMMVQCGVAPLNVNPMIGPYVSRVGLLAVGLLAVEVL